MPFPGGPRAEHPRPWGLGLQRARGAGGRLGAFVPSFPWWPSPAGGRVFLAGEVGERPGPSPTGPSAWAGASPVLLSQEEMRTCEMFSSQREPCWEEGNEPEVRGCTGVPGPAAVPRVPRSAGSPAGRGRREVRVHVLELNVRDRRTAGALSSLACVFLWGPRRMQTAALGSLRGGAGSRLRGYRSS